MKRSEEMRREGDDAWNQNRAREVPSSLVIEWAAYLVASEVAALRELLEERLPKPEPRTGTDNVRFTTEKWPLVDDTSGNHNPPSRDEGRDRARRSTP